MEKYFDIRYEFDVPTVHTTIDEHIANGKTGYICVADGMDAQTAPGICASHIQRAEKADKTLLAHYNNTAVYTEERDKNQETESKEQLNIKRIIRSDYPLDV